MKILVVCQHYYPEQFRINDICESLAQEGNEVTVLTGLPNYPKGIVKKEYKFFRRRKECINNVNIIRCFEIGRRKGTLFRILNYISYMCSASIKAIFLEKDFDVIYVYQLSPITMAMPAIIYKKIHKNKRICLYCLDLWPESLLAANFNKNGKIYKVIKRLSKWIYQKCDDIAVTSRGFIDYFHDTLDIKKNVDYLPQYAEDNYKFTNGEKDRNIKAGIDFVFAGNIGKAQSVETIIKAANELKNEKIMIHIIGDGISLEECRLLAQELKTDNVIFYGRKPVEEMKEYYDMADAMIITLFKNDIIGKTIPGKLQSYMEAGKPIIGAIGGETSRIIEEAKCGYCAEPEDYVKLSKLMEQFKNDTIEAREEMAYNSYQYYKNNFDKEKFMKKLLNILEGKKNV